MTHNQVSIYPDGRLEMDAIEKQLTSAFRMARRGIPVLRLDRYSKHPTTHGWQKTATTDATVIFKWDTPFNYAEVLPDGLLVVDVDDIEAGDAFQRQHGELPEHTWIKRTPGLKRGQRGLHLYYRLPDGVQAKTRQLGGVDILASGSTVIGVASMQQHENVTGIYQWLRGHNPRDHSKPAEAPAWLVELVRDEAQAQRKEGPSVEELRISDELKRRIRKGKPIGERSNALWGVIRAMVKAGHTDDEIIDVFMDERNGLSEKPREKGEAWLRSEIDRARNKPDENPPDEKPKPEKRLPRIVTLDEVMRMEIRPPQMVVDGLLPEGVTLFTGKHKAGKSLWALQLAIDVASGQAAFGEFPVEQGEVLCLSLEDPPLMFKDRLSRLIEGGPRPGKAFHTIHPDERFGALNYRDWIKLIESWLKNRPNARLVTVDTLAKVRDPITGKDWFGEDYRTMDSWRPLLRPGLSIVVASHLRKQEPVGGDWTDKIAGSTGLQAAADNIYMLERNRNELQGALDMTGRAIAEESRGWQFDYPRWRPLGPDEELSDTRQKIVEVLREAEHPLTPKEISEKTRLNHSTIKVRVRDMVAAGQLASDGKGYYRLP